MISKYNRLAASSFYFFFYAALAAYMPFLVLYYQSLGLDARQIGLLAGLPPLMTLFGAPVWSALADISQRHRLLFVTALASAIGFALLISQAQLFALLIPLAAAQAMFGSPVMPMVDSTVMNMLGEQKSQYGRLRMWGTVGWGIMAPLAGLVVEAQGLAWIFGIYAVVMVAALLVGQTLPLGRARLAGSFFGKVRLLLAERHWMLFLALVFTGGMGLSAMNNFLFIYMDTLGASKSLMGISLTIATASEVPVMFFTSQLIKRISPRGLLILGLLAFAIRSLAYSMVQTAWPILLIQLLHGATFGSIWVAGVSYADAVSPEGLGATAQGLFIGVFMGVGAATGAFLGGQLYESLGGAWMFRVMALIVVVSLAGFLIAERLIRRREAASVV